MAHEEEIRQTAYRLWEQAGRPEGRDQEFWYDAQRTLESRERSGNGMSTAGVSSKPSGMSGEQDKSGAARRPPPFGRPGR